MQTIWFKVYDKMSSTQAATIEDAQKIWDYFEMAGFEMVSARP